MAQPMAQNPAAGNPANAKLVAIIVHPDIGDMIASTDQISSAMVDDFAAGIPPNTTHEDNGNQVDIVTWTWHNLAANQPHPIGGLVAMSTDVTKSGQVPKKLSGKPGGQKQSARIMKSFQAPNGEGKFFAVAVFSSGGSGQKRLLIGMIFLVPRGSTHFNLSSDQIANIVSEIQKGHQRAKDGNMDKTTDFVMDLLKQYGIREV